MSTGAVHFVTPGSAAPRIMRSLLIIAAVVGLAFGDIGLKLREAAAGGYHYDAPAPAPAAVPATSYGVPSYSVSTGNAGSAGYQAANTGYQAANTGYQAANTGYQTANTGYQTTGNTGYQTTGNTGYQAASNTGYQAQYTPQQDAGYQATSSFQSGYQQPQVQYVDNTQNVQAQYQSSQQYQSAVVQKYQESYKQQPAQVFKHFYVHAAPEEPEQPKFRQPQELPAPQKHYKIIFIKTPAAQQPAPQVVPVPAQQEEKTIVYVLVPKPEEQQQIAVPKIEQKPPTKPEVFFIKYKGKEGSNALIENIVNTHKADGSIVNFSGAEASGAGVVANDYAVPVSSGQALSSTFGAGQQQQQQEQETADVATGFQAVSSAQAGYSAGESQQQESFNAIPSSQGVPHESYGPPKFRN